MVFVSSLPYYFSQMRSHYKSFPMGPKTSPVPYFKLLNNFCIIYFNNIIVWKLIFHHKHFLNILNFIQTAFESFTTDQLKVRNHLAYFIELGLFKNLYQISFHKIGCIENAPEKKTIWYFAFHYMYFSSTNLLGYTPLNALYFATLWLINGFISSICITADSTTSSCLVSMSYKLWNGRL